MKEHPFHILQNIVILYTYYILLFQKSQLQFSIFLQGMEKSRQSAYSML